MKDNWFTPTVKIHHKIICVRCVFMLPGQGSTGMVLVWSVSISAIENSGSHHMERAKCYYW